MKTNNSKIIPSLELFVFTSNKLHIKTTKKSSYKNYYTNIKLKLLHSGKNEEQKYNENITHVLKYNNDIVSALKIVYEVSYKYKVDQQQVNRKIINIFKDLKLEKDNKQISSYKNTETLNRIYQLYKFKYELHE